ncbi:AGAP009528-PA-like protein [Anopheles sinensis]|uniref:AGAP009528-PA-like protein n=1 Tax=Anopheles sinensis TaxID=74873 RepID=A0A084VLU3_ANOSI|nr:AGAP009528-PA-like protein [Anopheles sinensis]
MSNIETNPANDLAVRSTFKVVNIYTEFPEFSRKEIKVANDGYLNLAELKRMVEKLGAPQTNVGLKGLFAEVHKDQDRKPIWDRKE